MEQRKPLLLHLLLTLLPKGCKTALAESVPDGADALSSCCAGRQDSWLGIQPDAHLYAKDLSAP